MRGLYEYMEEAGMKPVAGRFGTRSHAAGKSRSAGGQPGTHQWGLIMIEGAGWILENGIPKTHAELERHLHDWSGNEFGRYPDESEMTKIVSKLVARLKAANNKPPR